MAFYKTTSQAWAFPRLSPALISPPFFCLLTSPRLSFPPALTRVAFEP